MHDPRGTSRRKVWHRPLKTGKTKKGKIEIQMSEGLWIGHARNSNEALIGTGEGVVRAYDVHRMPEDERWDGMLVTTMKGTPTQPDPKKAGSHIPIRVNVDVEEHDEEVTKVQSKDEEIRRIPITMAMLRKYGYMEGCDGCKQKRIGMGVGRPHSEQCRQRIMDELEKDEEGKRMLEKNDERIMRKMAERVEAGDLETKAKNCGRITRRSMSRRARSTCTGMSLK